MRFVAAPTRACTGRRLTFHRRLVTLWALLMRFPACGFLPQISHCCAMMTPENFRTWCAKHRFYRSFDDFGKVALSRYPACRCSRIMSPPNCNETLSPYQEGGESDRECGGREAERTRSLGAASAWHGSGRRDGLVNPVTHQLGAQCAVTFSIAARS